MQMLAHLYYKTQVSCGVNEWAVNLGVVDAQGAREHRPTARARADRWGWITIRYNGILFYSWRWLNVYFCSLHWAIIETPNRKTDVWSSPRLFSIGMPFVTQILQLHYRQLILYLALSRCKGWIDAPSPAQVLI